MASCPGAPVRAVRSARSPGAGQGHPLTGSQGQYFRDAQEIRQRHRKEDLEIGRDLSRAQPTPAAGHPHRGALSPPWSSPPLASGRESAHSQRLCP